jgi:hypothetical protein
MSDAANDLPLLIVVASTRANIDDVLVAATARLPGCRTVRVPDLSSRLGTRAGISALGLPTAESEEPLLPSASTVLVAAPAQMAPRFKAAHPAAVTVALVDVSYLHMRTAWRDRHRSPESEQIDLLAQHEPPASAGGHGKPRGRGDRLHRTNDTGGDSRDRRRESPSILLLLPGVRARCLPLRKHCSRGSTPMAKSDPDRVTRDTASFLGTGLGKAYSTTVGKGRKTYTGHGWTRKDADRRAGEKYQRGEEDKR